MKDGCTCINLVSMIGRLFPGQEKRKRAQDRLIFGPVVTG